MVRHLAIRLPQYWLPVFNMSIMAKEASAYKKGLRIYLEIIIHHFGEHGWLTKHTLMNMEDFSTTVYFYIRIVSRLVDSTFINFRSNRVREEDTYALRVDTIPWEIKATVVEEAMESFRFCFK